MSATLPASLPLAKALPSPKPRTAGSTKAETEKEARLSIRKDVALAVGGGLVAGGILKGLFTSPSRMYRQLEAQRRMELHNLKLITLFTAGIPGLALLFLLN